MMNTNTLANAKTLAICLAVLTVVPAVACGCPTCKDGIAGDPAASGLVQGYFWSIVFMMSMPFLILGGISAYFYYEVCRARRQKAQTDLESTGLATDQPVPEAVTHSS